MAYDYDSLYRDTKDALGAPNPEIAAFFGRFDRRGARVLDVGCGQGRDGLAIARAGHRVVGVDLSPHGVADMLHAARAEGLAVDGVVADIATFIPEGQFDVIVMDRVLHMLPEGDRHAMLARLLGHVAERGWVLIVDEPSNRAGLEAVIRQDAVEWRIVTAKRGLLFVQAQ